MRHALAMRHGSPLLQAFEQHSWEVLRWHLLLLAGTLLLGLLLGTAVERRFHSPNWRAALLAALDHGVALPLVALLALQLSRHASWALLHAEILQLMLAVLAVWLITRVAARAAQRSLRDPALVRWLILGVRVFAGIGLLLYLAGALPLIKEALDAVSVHIGRQRLTAWTLLRGGTSVAVTLVLALWV
ncbi:MAG: mechanosensitive ion channel protein MscS, partial [Betaproteobacteria bacterium]|nr:mechanosensitive ion channel protein MscS [Betaproteobacteria bacterium]